MGGVELPQPARLKTNRKPTIRKGIALLEIVSIFQRTGDAVFCQGRRRQRITGWADLS